MGPVLVMVHSIKFYSILLCNISLCFYSPDRLKEQYDAWLSTTTAQTPAGNLSAPSKDLLGRWVVEAWRDIPDTIIANSFKTCGLTTLLDGSEAGRIKCIRDYPGSLEAFQAAVGRQRGTAEDPFLVAENGAVEQDNANQYELGSESDVELDI